MRHKGSTVLAYFKLTKPKSVSLLVFTAFGGMVLASATLDVALTPISLAIVDRVHVLEPIPGNRLPRGNSGRAPLTPRERSPHAGRAEAHR